MPSFTYVAMVFSYGEFCKIWWQASAPVVGLCHFLSAGSFRNNKNLPSTMGFIPEEALNESATIEECFEPIQDMRLTKLCFTDVGVANHMACVKWQLLFISI